MAPTAVCVAAGQTLTTGAGEPPCCGSASAPAEPARAASCRPTTRSTVAATAASLRRSWSGSLRLIVVDNGSARRPDLAGAEDGPLSAEHVAAAFARIGPDID